MTILEIISIISIVAVVVASWSYLHIESAIHKRRLDDGERRLINVEQEILKLKTIIKIFDDLKQG